MNACASLSRRFLQPLIRQRAAYTNPSEPLYFLYPTYSTTSVSRPLIDPRKHFTNDVHCRTRTSRQSALQKRGIRSSAKVSHPEIASNSTREKTPGSVQFKAVLEEDIRPPDGHNEENHGQPASNTLLPSTLQKPDGARADSVGNTERARLWPTKANTSEGKQSTFRQISIGRNKKHQLRTDTVEGLRRRHREFPVPIERVSRFEKLHDEHVENLFKRRLMNRLRNEHASNQLRNKGSLSWDWKETIRLLLEELPKTRQEIDISNDGARRIHEASTFDLKNNSFLAVPISQIPMPSTWTKASFAQYVHDLCRSRMPRTIGRGFREVSGHNHHEEVRAHLEKFIFTEFNSELMSSQVFESALRFFYRFEFTPSVRLLFAYMMEIDFPHNNTCFDIVLRNAAMHRDLGNFTSLLEGALLMGFVPSSTTWASLVICLQSDRAIEFVLNLMDEHHLFASSTVRQDLAINILERRLFMGTYVREDTDTILKALDDRLYQDWFCIKSANVILKYLCMSPDGYAIREFLKLMESRGCSPDRNSLNLLLQRCARIRDLRTAIELFAEFTLTRKTLPDEMSFDLLFQTAWAKQSTNVCRIVWAAACMYKNVSFPMEDVIIQSIVGKKATETPAGLWKSRAGPLMLGIRPKKEQNLPENLLGIPQTSTSQSTLSSPAKETDGIAGHSVSIELIHQKMRRDQKLHYDFVYHMDSLVSDLRMALAEDQYWVVGSGLRNRPLEWHVKQMIHPRIKRRLRGK